MTQNGNGIIFSSVDEARKLYDALINEGGDNGDIIDELTDILKQIFDPDPQNEE